MASLAKWFSVRLQTKWFWVRVQLQYSTVASERLYLTIHYLAYANSQHDLSFTHRIGRSTVLMIIRKTCKALWDSLSVQYYRSPQNKGQIAKDFEELWNLSHCVGARMFGWSH